MLCQSDVLVSFSDSLPLSVFSSHHFIALAAIFRMHIAGGADMVQRTASRARTRARTSAFDQPVCGARARTDLHQSAERPPVRVSARRTAAVPAAPAGLGAIRSRPRLRVSVLGFCLNSYELENVYISPHTHEHTISVALYGYSTVALYVNCSRCRTCKETIEAKPKKRWQTGFELYNTLVCLRSFVEICTRHPL